MKKYTKGLSIILFSAVVAIAATLCSTGCKTVSPGQPSGVLSQDTNGIIYIGSWAVKTNDVYVGIKIAATIGTEQGLRADTNSIVYFQAVEQVLNVALDSGQFDPIALRESISELPFDVNPDVNDGIVAGLALYQAFFGEVVAQKIDNASPYLRPALTALRDGIAAIVPATEITSQ